MKDRQFVCPRFENRPGSRLGFSPKMIYGPSPRGAFREDS